MGNIVGGVLIALAIIALILAIICFVLVWPLWFVRNQTNIFGDYDW